ncbi:MAG: dephospho-CoA kinase [Candidatus Delongbacteria bacterium]|jgi:dephospho-CoA kinase|nr:dephospho-CoA kinase [Candidatus Delongbacteria bacterium]
MKIGICGRSGSGKSTASDYFLKKGYKIINLDLYAKTLDNKYPEILSKIKDAFGDKYISDGMINRKMLGELVFGSEKELEKLNKIYFEYLKKDMIKLLDKEQNIVIEGAVIFEIELEKHLDRTIYVTVDEAILLERIAKREKDSIETLKNRLKLQIKYDAYISKADYIINTNGTVEELYQKLNTLGL